MAASTALLLRNGRVVHPWRIIVAVESSPERPVVTRRQIAAAVRTAFESGPATKTELVAHAAGAKASRDVLAVLDALPDQRYVDLRAIWPALDGVPVR